MTEHLAKPSNGETNQLEHRPSDQETIQALFYGNLAGLTEQQKAMYLWRLSELLGVNPASKPFDIITVEGGKRQVVYANKSCAAQLQVKHGISIEEVYAGPLQIAQEFDTTIYVVKVRVKSGDGRVSYNLGTSALVGLKGVPLANEISKCHTKAYRRGVLAHCGFGFPDVEETEYIGVHRPDGPRMLSPTAGVDVPAALVDAPIEAQILPGAIPDAPPKKKAPRVGPLPPAVPPIDVSK